MAPITYFYIFLTALFTSLVLIPPVARLAVRFGGMDKTDERKVHEQDIPRLGGVAIFFAFLLSIILFFPMDLQTRGFLAGAMVIFLTGLFDDLITLTAAQKMAGEVTAVLIALMLGGGGLISLGNLFNQGDLKLGILTIPFTLFAVVGVINAVNLLDGLDGLAAGVSTIAAASFGILAFMTGNEILLVMAVALMGALLGFLNYNTYPARIFMGDSGSLFLGYCMGFFSILLVNRSGGFISHITPLYILAIPIIDTGAVMFLRLRAGKSIFLPDRSHIHHRLLNMGIGHKVTVIVVYGFSYLMSAIAVCSYQVPDHLLMLGLVLVYSLLYFALKLLVKLSVRHGIWDLSSNQPVRETATYRSIVKHSQTLKLVVKYLVFVVLILYLLVPSSELHQFASVSAFLAILSLVLLLTTRDWGNRFLQFVLYFNGAFIIYQMENGARSIAFLDLPFLTLSNLLFLFLFLTSGIKVFLRNRTAKLMSNPLEYLLLFILISVPLFPEQFTYQHHLLTVAGKSVILFVAYKLILMNEPRRNREVVLATMVALVAAAVKGYWS